MHLFISGIGGVGMSSLALIAKQAGFEVSGSDKQQTQYIDYLASKGITNVHIGQTSEQIALANQHHPIDWYVYSSAVEKENPNHPELVFVKQAQIRLSKRDELLNYIISEKKLKLIAIAGTHGKTTTTAMAIWLFKQLNLPASYSVGAKIGPDDAGQYMPNSEYFIYECDEFDRNFLKFSPFLSIISGVSYDHHEIYPTREDYQQAFRDFISQSKHTVLWDREAKYLGLTAGPNLSIPSTDDMRIEQVKLIGRYNRENAWLVIQALGDLLKEPYDKLTEIMNHFPGLHRRMEEVAPNIFSDEAHTPDKIRGAMSVALELARERDKEVIVVYEPLTNRRQHYMIDDYQDCFMGAKQVYWLPSYLAREDPNQPILSPEELIAHLANPELAEAKQQDEALKHTIQQHVEQGDMVVCMSGGGGNSLDEWLRNNFTNGR